MKKPSQTKKCRKCRGTGKQKIGEASFVCSCCSGTGVIEKKAEWYVKAEPVEIIRVEVVVTKHSEMVKCYVDEDTWYSDNDLCSNKNEADYECCSRNGWRKPEEVKEAEICEEPPF